MKSKFVFSILFLFLFLFMASGGWLPTDIRIDTGDLPGAGDSYYPKIACSGDNVYVAWEDRRDGWRDIYFNSSTDKGTNWQASDIRLDTGDLPGAYESYDIQIACSGDNVYVVWHDARNGARDIYFNYSADGGASWQTPDIRLDTGDPPGAGYSWYPQISCFGTTVHVVWHDFRTESSADIYYNYSTDGGATWQTPDIRLDTGDIIGAHGSYAPEIFCSGDNVYVVWQDERYGEFKYDIYFKSSTDGGVTWPTQEIRINTGDSPGASESWNPQIACSGDNLYVVWEDERNGEYNFDIYFNYSIDGGKSWQASDIRLDTGDSPGANNSSLSQIACSGSNVYVVWDDDRNAPHIYRDIYLNHSSDGGATWQTPDIRLNTGVPPGAHDSGASNITCSNGNIYAAWTDYRGGGNISDIFFKFSMDDGTSWKIEELRINNRQSLSDYPAKSSQIACSGETVYFVWQDSRNGYADIYFNSVALPKIDIKANSSDDPITISSTDTLAVTIELTAGTPSGMDADWWLTAKTPLGWYHYNPTSGWLPGREVSLQRPLSNFPSKEILSTSNLPPGTYTFYFGIDLLMNGSIDMNKAFYDKVKVTINP